MKFKDIRVWIFIFGMVSLVAVYLYQQSKTNREQLEFQSVKAIHLAKESLLENYFSYNVQLEEYLVRNFFRLLDDDPNSPAAQMVAIVDKGEKFNISKIRAVPTTEKASAFMIQPSIAIIQKDTLTYFTIQNHLFDFSKGITQLQVLDNNKRLSNQVKSAIAWEFVGTDAGDSPTGLFQIDHIVPIDELMKYNFQTHFFDELYVLNDSGEVLWPGESKGIQLLTEEEATPEVSEAGVSLNNKGQSKIKLLINTVSYEGFVSPFMLGDKSFFLLGVKNSEQFQQVAYRIDFSVLSVFLLGLVFIFISIPLISIFTMSEGDILTKGRMFGLGISLIVLTLVVGFALAFIQNQRATPSYESVIGEIEDAFSSQIESFDAKLKQYKGETDANQIGTVLLPLPAGINELIQFSYNGEISDLIFPYANGLHCINFHTNPFISIAARDYVKEISKDQEHSFISAHYSKSSGKLEGVISQRMTENEGRALTFGLTEGKGDLGKHHRFFVFKPDGQVLLKSDKVNTPVTNLQNVIGENKWAELQKIVLNNDLPDQVQVWEIPIYVNGFEYLARLKRLPLENFSTSIWLIFLVDEHLQDTLFILTTFEALAVLTPYFLILGILGFLIVLANPSNTYLKAKKFSFGWFSPSIAKRNQYLLSNYMLSLQIVLYLIVYWFIPLNIFTAFLWAVVFTCQGGLSNFILIHPQVVGKYGSREFNFLAPAFFMWMAVVATLLYLSFVSLNDEFFLGTLGIILILLAMLGGCFYGMHQNKLPRLNPNFPKNNREMSFLKSLHFRITRFWNFVTQIQVEKRIFSLNFLLWLTLIGLMPGYIIHRQVFFQESYLWDPAVSHDLQMEVQRKPQALYLDLIINHEKLRRLNFSKISTSEEEKVYAFISPKVEEMIASFNLKKSWNMEKKDQVPNSFLDVIVGKLGDKPLFLICVALLLLLFFNLLLRLSKRIYLTDFLFSYQGKKLPVSCLDRKYNFIISIDNMKALEWIDFHFMVSVEKRLVISCSGGSPELPELMEGIDVIVIENIHNLAVSDEFLTIMYQFREAYFFTGKAIFITSGTSLKDILTTIGSAKDRLLLAEMMQPFLFYIVPLNFNNKTISVPFTGKSIESLPPEEVDSLNSMIKSRLFNDTKTLQLNREIGYGANSEALACLLTEEIATDDWESEMVAERYEKIILSIQRFNKAYLITIWQKLNLNEKKMVYYFASEGFINYTNRETMTALLQKGVLTLNYQQDYITLFSKSFRNYILLNTSLEELDAFRRDERSKGNTKLIQAASISFVFICIAILSFYDPNILDTTSAYISAAIGLAGTVYSFFYKGFRNFLKNEE